MNSHPSKSSSCKHHVPFFMNTGVVIGLAVAIPMGSIGVGIATGLCLSFLGGIVYRRMTE